MSAAASDLAVGAHSAHVTAVLPSPIGASDRAGPAPATGHREPGSAGLGSDVAGEAEGGARLDQVHAVGVEDARRAVAAVQRGQEVVVPHPDADPAGGEGDGGELLPGT